MFEDHPALQLCRAELSKEAKQEVLHGLLSQKLPLEGSPHGEAHGQQLRFWLCVGELSDNMAAKAKEALRSGLLPATRVLVQNVWARAAVGSEEVLLDLAKELEDVAMPEAFATNCLAVAAQVLLHPAAGRPEVMESMSLRVDSEAKQKLLGVEQDLKGIHDEANKVERYIYIIVYSYIVIYTVYIYYSFKALKRPESKAPLCGGLLECLLRASLPTLSLYLPVPCYGTGPGHHTRLVPGVLAAPGAGCASLPEATISSHSNGIRMARGSVFGLSGADAGLGELLLVHGEAYQTCGYLSGECRQAGVDIIKPTQGLLL